MEFATPRIASFLRRTSRRLQTLKGWQRPSQLRLLLSDRLNELHRSPFFEAVDQYPAE